MMPSMKAVTAKDIRTFFKGEKVNRFERQMETPQAQTTEIWMNDNLAYTLENKVLLDAASRVLTRIYLRTIREEESAAYNVGCGGDIDNFGAKPVFFLTAQAPTNPDKQTIAEDLMMKYLKECMENIDEADLSPVKETMLKQAEDADRENGHWMDVLTEWTAEGVDLQTNYAETVKALTSQKVQSFIADFIAAGNHASIVMMPEK